MLHKEVLVAGLVLFATGIVMATPTNNAALAVRLNIKNYMTSRYALQCKSYYWKQPITTRGTCMELTCANFEFVNTTQQIWTYTTTSNSLVRCELDQMQYVHPLSISFRRSFLYNETRMDVQLRGVFDRFHKQRMTLFDEGLWKFVCVEKMLYVARDGSCAVFKIKSITERNSIRYDLRVKNSTIRLGPNRACRRYLHRVKGPRVLYTIYSHDCQRMSTTHQQATQ